MVKKVLKGAGGKSPTTTMLLRSGSTLLDLGCSGSREGAYLTGHYYFFCGDSGCGKTWLGMSAMAEAAIDPRFDDYRLIYDPTEEGALMNVEHFFGSTASKRIEWRDPPSETAEDFYFALADAQDDGRPFVWVLDSQDALSSKAEQAKFEETKEAHEKGKATTGTYGDSKAKVHSANIRRAVGRLKRNGSILIVLGQTRDSFDMFMPKTYSGGRALLFYCTYQMWGTVKKQITKQIKGKKRQLGIEAQIRIKKNRETGKNRTVEIPILHSYGIDDVGSCVQYLVDEKAWKANNGIVVVEGLGPSFKGRLDEVVRKIEEEDMEDDLRELVEQRWNEIEDACKVKRKKRY